MKCVANVNCQTRLASGKIKMFFRGEVDDFDKCPANFSPLEGEEAKELDFLKASEEELLAAKWTFEAAFVVVSEEFGIKLKRGKKADIVAQILDARYRKVD
jgi:hypothetical protein